MTTQGSIVVLFAFVVLLSSFIYLPRLRDIHPSPQIFQTNYRTVETQIEQQQQSNTPSEWNASIPRIQQQSLVNHTIDEQKDPHQIPLIHQVDSGATKQVDLNRTKIVGFISSHYTRVALRWYDRLETLGYTNHYIICADNKTFDILQTHFPTYRAEASFLPEFPAEYLELKSGRKERHRVEMLFAHRWVYMLEQLKLGNHILLTDVDNIFSSYYSMNELESSEYDIYHALETKHPEEVFKRQGFVVCGGMGWFRASPGAIRYVEKMVKRCGIECDDQVLLNKLLAYDLNMKWGGPTNELSNTTTITTKVTPSDIDGGKENIQLAKRLDGLITVGFTGYSVSTGIKIKIWDRDFAFRGEVNPRTCPSSQNWVSMPFVIVVTRKQTPHAKLKAYDIWDNHCPNHYSNMTADIPKKNYQELPGLSSQ
jgi:Nucleotide-diphospho-sugar transferase